MPVSLKTYAYLTLAETKDHLVIGASDTSQDDRVTRMINSACKLVESYIDGPVLTRTFIETRDGNSANSIVFGHRPVRSITSIKVDYLHQFGAGTEILAENYVLRGPADPLQASGDSVVRVLGQDVVLRDDNNTALLGRLFNGSVVQSIQLTYTAGWGTAATAPDDLIQATLMMVEYWYRLRDNRDVGISSRNNGQQSYARYRAQENGGIPIEVQTILDPYKDHSLGSAENPQHNAFTL